MAITPFRAAVGRVATQAQSGVERSVAAQMREINEGFEHFISHMEDMVPEILVMALAPTFAKSQERVPVMDGDLKASGYLQVVERVRGLTTVEIGYGKNGSPPYAAIVHEDLTAAHKAPTTAKYLQGPLNEDYWMILQRLTDLSKYAGGAS